MKDNYHELVKIMIDMNKIGKIQEYLKIIQDTIKENSKKYNAKSFEELNQKIVENLQKGLERIKAKKNNR